MRSIYYSAISIMLFPSAACAQALPTLNIRLRHICLSIADNSSGEVRVVSLNRLPAQPPKAALRITQRWSPAATTSSATIYGEKGVELNVVETIVPFSACNKAYVDKLTFYKSAKGQEAKVCISPDSSNGNVVKVSLRLTGPSGQDAAEFLKRLNAVALCYQPRGLNAEYDGFTIGRVIVRTKS
jgi:hypothetical protein